MSSPQEDSENWNNSYFNYFTQIEEHFQRARGTALFLLSPIDWALIESWKNNGVPLEAVLRGIDEAFEKWRNRKIKTKLVNSLAYCAQAVLEHARAMAGTTARKSRLQSDSTFTEEELKRHLTGCANALRAKEEAVFRELARDLDEAAANVAVLMANLEDLERRLTACEDRMVAAARTLQSSEIALAIRTQLDMELRPYRGKMTAEQLAMLERRYLDSATLERAELPRLSLFFLQ